MNYCNILSIEVACPSNFWRLNQNDRIAQYPARGTANPI